MSAFDTKQAITHQFGITSSQRTQQGYPMSECMEIVGEVLVALADWMDSKDREFFASISSSTLRSIANAKPDPLADLSAEDRLGYALEKERHGEDWAIRIYIAEREAYGDLRTRENATAAAVIAEYERQKGGAK